MVLKKLVCALAAITGTYGQLLSGINETSSQPLNATEESILPELEQDLFLKYPHPQVQGKSNVLQLEVRGSNDYYGHLFTGSEYRETRMIFDTTTPWTTVNTNGIATAQLVSNYDLEESTSAKPIKGATNNAADDLNDTFLKHGTVGFTGNEYRDKMCLYQTRNDRTDASGRMCVRGQKFLAVNDIEGDFEANGIIGLAPVNDDRNYIRSLFFQGQILEQRIGLNIEDPNDVRQISTITVGYFDYDQIIGGEDGFNYYANLGLQVWAILMQNVKYDHFGLTENSLGRMAILDTGNTSIQIPNSEFEVLKKKMKEQDSSIIEQNVEDSVILVSRRQCKDLYDILGDIEFLLHETMIVIKPRGYLYSLPNQKDCFIGVQSIPDAYNQYRLGTIFLRNFYVGLDYDQNQMLVGLNKNPTTADGEEFLGGPTAEMHGKSEDPHKRRGSGAIWFVIFFFFLLGGIATFFYIKHKQMEQDKTSTFASKVDETKKRFKNGVQVKSSETDSKKEPLNKKASIIETQEEESLDEEQLVNDD